MPKKERMNAAPPDLGVLIDHYLAGFNEFRDAERNARKAEEGTDREPEIYASQLGKCLRQQYLTLKGVPRRDTIDAKTLRTFAWGDHVEAFARKVYQRLGLVVPPKNPRMQYGNLVARGDILLRFPPENVDDIPADLLLEWSPEWVAFLKELRSSLPTDWEGNVWSEIKSTKSTAMRYLIDEGPRFAHKIQVGASMLIAEQDPSQLPMPIDHWELCYIGKDAVGVVRFPGQESWMREAQHRWKLLEAADSAADLPCECECLCSRKWMKAHSDTPGHVGPNDPRAYKKWRHDDPPFCWVTSCGFFSGEFDVVDACCSPELETA